MLSTTAREAAVSRPRPARLLLQGDHSGRTTLDGGWWPRSADPATELPGLILALDERHGRITRLMLGAADWKASRPRQLTFAGPAGGRVVHLGWFATMPTGMLTAISVSGRRTDLLTVPPDTSEKAAQAAMQQAVQPGNRDHSPAILAAIPAAEHPSAPISPEGSQLDSREREDTRRPGHQEAGPDRSRPAAGQRPAPIPAAGPGPS